MSMPGPFGVEARHLGKSARTRAKLLDAATALFARSGFEAASVNEIARLADVANGTFYVHFRDKDEIAAEVAFRIAASVAKQLDDAMANVSDAEERTSTATRRFIELAVNAPEWGWAMLKGSWIFKDLRSAVVGYLRADLERGAEQGSFKVPIDDFLVDILASMTMTALHGRLRGEVGADAGSRVAELQLRMLGVDPCRANAIAFSPLTPLGLDLPKVVLPQPTEKTPL